MNTRQEEIVKKLVATKKWDAVTAALGAATDFHCAYCDLDFLETPETYKLWQVDHIVPVSCGGSPSDPSNLVVACKTCNWDWKGRWDPRKEAGAEATRAQLIEAVRKHVGKCKANIEEELKLVREIAGRKTA